MPEPPWGPEACKFIKKETLAQGLFREYCETPKNTHFHRTPPVAVSEQIKKVLSIFDKILYLSTYLNSSFLLIRSSISEKTQVNLV